MTRKRAVYDQYGHDGLNGRMGGGSTRLRTSSLSLAIFHTSSDLVAGVARPTDPEER